MVAADQAALAPSAATSDATRVTMAVRVSDRARHLTVRTESVARATDGETARTFFRTNRYFVASNQWFFSTREAGDRGPFDTPDQAERALQRFLRDEVGIRLSGWDQPGSDL